MASAYARLRFGSLLFICALLGACASSVERQRDAVTAGHRLGTERLNTVTVKLSASAQQKLADNAGFSADALEAQLRQTLAQLLDPSGKRTLEVTITDLRVRSTFSAVMFGFMAGNDSLQGDVRVLGPDGAGSAPFTVRASYALGGLAGGQDSSRMNWLYGEFAKLTSAELVGPTP